MTEYKLFYGESFIGDTCLVIRKRKFVFWYTIKTIWKGSFIDDVPEHYKDLGQELLTKARKEKW